MKKEFIVPTMSVLLVISILFTACQKGNVQNNDSKLSPKEVVLNENSIFLLNGKIPMTFAEYQKRKAEKLGLDSDDEESIIIDYNGENVIFENDSELRIWALEKDSTGQIIALLDKKDSLIDYATQRGILDDSLATLAYSDSLEAAEQQANAGPAPLLSTLYNGYNYSGGTHTLAFISIRPTLGAFNGKASSLADWFLLPKVNLLASKTWFRGSKYFYWSWTFRPNLGNVNFDNKAKSKL